MKAIFIREWKSYFTNMLGYIFIAFMLLIFGISMAASNLSTGNPAFETVINNTSFLFLIIVPIITMRVFAEERRQKTDQLLFSLPFRITEIVFAKYFALLCLFAVPIAIVCLYPLILGMFGAVAYSVAYCAIFGYFMLGAAALAIGMFLSSVTENQLISAVLCFGVLLILYFTDSLAAIMPTTPSASLIAIIAAIVLFASAVYFITKNNLYTTLSFILPFVSAIIIYIMHPLWFEGLFPKILMALAIFNKLDSFIYGLLDIPAAIYFLTIAGLSLFFTVQSLEKRRWS